MTSPNTTAQQPDADDRPLAGIRIIDFTRVVAGPLATRILADQGAEVIKIEPTEGDLSRTFPPHAGDLNSEFNPYFAQQNVGKRFCSVNLREPAGVEMVAELIAQADAVVENYRPGVMARFGLGPDELCERHPSLVFCSVTGFGQTGPWADRRAYAPIGHLESGLLEYDQRKTGRPALQPAIVLGDVVSALTAAANINAMLTKAARTGRGGAVDVCMVEAMVYIQEWVSTELAGGYVGTNPGCCEQCPILVLPDGRVWGIAGNPVGWFDGLANAMGRPELLDDPRFADPLVRESNRDVIVAMMTEWAASFAELDDFRRALEGGSMFTVAELRSLRELVETDWAAERGLIAETTGGHRVPARPAVGSGIGTTGYLADVGADNEAVFGELLGYDAERVAKLTAEGVLRGPA